MGIHSGKIILGLDPGRDKIGFAFVDSEGGLISSGIFSQIEHVLFFHALLSDSQSLSRWTLEGNTDLLPKNIADSLEFTAIGNGTHSRTFTDLAKNFLPCEVLTVDERNTTLEARALYWRLHKPGIFMRILPEGLRVPDRMLDDLAAWAIAIRGLKKYRDIRRNKL